MKIGKYHITSKYVNIKLTPRQRFYIFICSMNCYGNDLSPRHCFFQKQLTTFFYIIEKASACTDPQKLDLKI